MRASRWFKPPPPPHSQRNMSLGLFEQLLPLSNESLHSNQRRNLSTRGLTFQLG